MGPVRIARPDRADAPRTDGAGSLRARRIGVLAPRVDALPDGRSAAGGLALAGLGIPTPVQIHVLSFEGPDPYSRVGGLETRVSGLCEAFVSTGHETHLWFVGDADLSGHETRAGLRLHRWCQWLSRHHPHGVYDGQFSKVPDYAGTLPPYLLAKHLLPHLRAGGVGVILAEEWQTVDAVLHLHHLLRATGLRHRARLLWNANNVFGFHTIDWSRLRRAAVITTVSRYMKQIMKASGIEAISIPNGLAPDAYLPPDRSAVAQLRRGFVGRTAIAKMARWDPDKGWLGTVEIVARLRQLGMKPLLIARGGREPYGVEVLRAMRSAGLSIVERRCTREGPRGLVRALSDLGAADVVHLGSRIEPAAGRVLFRASDVVLSNSGREPFGLVGLEAMAAGGLACTGCSGEDYAVAGRNAMVLQTDDQASEFIRLYRELRANPPLEAALRRAGRATARQFAWRDVIQTNLVPRLDLPRPTACAAE